VNSKWANKFNVINNAINRAKDRFGFDELSRGLYEYREPEPAPTAVSDGEASHR
jgi:hypothetical protein